MRAGGSGERFKVIPALKCRNNAPVTDPRCYRAYLTRHPAKIIFGDVQTSQRISSVGVEIQPRLR